MSAYVEIWFSPPDAPQTVWRIWAPEVPRRGDIVAIADLAGVVTRVVWEHHEVHAFLVTVHTRHVKRAETSAHNSVFAHPQRSPGE